LAVVLPASVAVGVDTAEVDDRVPRFDTSAIALIVGNIDR